LLLAAPAVGQDHPSLLRASTLVYAAVATSDASFTYYGLTHYRVGEMNPLVSPWEHRPAMMLGIGAGLDTGAVYAWNRIVGRQHPRIAAAGLYAVSAYRVYLCTRWTQVYQTAARR
jgi:hypothetical protein